MSDTSAENVEEHILAVPFETAVDRTRQAIAEAGLTLFAEIDHAAGARAVGLTMPPTIVLVYGSPKGGTPVMLAAPNAALDLPLRVLIRQRADGRTVMVFQSAGCLGSRFGRPGVACPAGTRATAPAVRRRGGERRAPSEG